MRIRTDHWPKPIPIRDFDWAAVTDDYDGAPDARPQCIGFGRTEQEAIADLMQQLEAEG